MISATAEGEDATQELLSIVVPCYNEAAALPLFYADVLRVVPLLAQIQIEMVFVDDGSRDDTCGYLQGLVAADARVRYLSFSRNFGKEAAILAGLKASRGTFVVLMDADLQTPSISRGCGHEPTVTN